MLQPRSIQSSFSLRDKILSLLDEFIIVVLINEIISWYLLLISSIMFFYEKGIFKEIPAALSNNLSKCSSINIKY